MNQKPTEIWFKAIRISIKTKSMLKMFEPITLPKAKSASFFFAATTLVTSSGRDVPTATIVKPIRLSLIPKLEAIIFAFVTTKSPPKTTPKIPIRMKIMLFGRERVFIFSSTCSGFFKADFTRM